MSRRVNTKRKPFVEENDVKEEGKRYLDRIGAFHFPIVQGKWCYPGISDRPVQYKGLTFWVEFKRPGGKQSKDQVKFQKDIEAQGGLYICVDNIPDLHKFINTHVKEHEAMKKLWRKKQKNPTADYDKGYSDGYDARQQEITKELEGY